MELSKITPIQRVQAIGYADYPKRIKRPIDVRVDNTKKIQFQYKPMQIAKISIEDILKMIEVQGVYFNRNPYVKYMKNHIIIVLIFLQKVHK